MLFPRLAVLLWVSALYACGEGPTDQSGRGQGGPPPVTVAMPLNTQVTEWDEFIGRFDAVEDVDIRSRVSGELTSIAFTDGQLVEAGQLLFVIDPEPFQLALNSARASLQESRARLEFTTNDLKRAQDLFKRRNISEQAVDERVEAKKGAEASVAAASAAVQQAELELGYTNVKSPISGRAGRHFPSVGNLITGGAGGTLLTTVVSLNPIHFYFDANEAAYLDYVALAREGARPSSRDVANPVELELINEDGFPHRGMMDFVDNEIDPNTGSMRGRAVFDNDENIFVPGMFGKLRLRGRANADALLLPDDAIGVDQTSRFVMVLNADDIAQPKRVELGPLYRGLRIIRSGLGADDRVVINGLMRVRPGSKVAPREGAVAFPGMPQGAQG